MNALGGDAGDSIDGLARLSRETAGRLASRHLESLRDESTLLCIVDKLPENYFLLGLLSSLFPRAKFIHCRRDFATWPSPAG